MYNGIGFYFSKSMHLSKKAIKKISGYNFNYNSEQEILSVYEMVAFFNRNKFWIKIKFCPIYLNGKKHMKVKCSILSLKNL